MSRDLFPKLRRVQKQLERLYGLEGGPDVAQFVEIANDGSREQLLIRERDSELELLLVLPPFGRAGGGESSDEWLQAVEGVSHFVFLVERARTGLPTTQLELELQAEVDKFVLSALDYENLDRSDAHGLLESLYDRVQYLHPAGTEAGDRYRLANQLAARFAWRVLDRHAPHSRLQLLRRFYRSGQTDKIALASAA